MTKQIINNMVAETKKPAPLWAVLIVMFGGVFLAGVTFTAGAHYFNWLIA